MRVVGGTARGTRLLVVPGSGTRPVMDRVKTALFDILRPRIESITMLDLFAGSGSIGIEALSQGAAHCTLIDKGHKAVATIKKNLDLTGLADRAQVLHTDALAYLRGTTETFDLIYVAPPQYHELWLEALRLIASRPELLRRSAADDEEGAPGGLVIAQIDPKEYESVDLGTIAEVRQKRYGNTLLVFYERRRKAPDDRGHTPCVPPGPGASGFPRPRLPRRDHFRLALRRDARAQLGAAVFGLGPEPVQRGLGRFGDGNEGQAGLDGACIADSCKTGRVAGARHPDRHVAPGMNAFLLEEVGVDPREARVAFGNRLAGLEHLADGQHLVGPERVEDSGCLVFDQPDQKGTQVADVDQLNRVAGRARGQHLAAARNADRPVREPVGGILGPDDQARAHNRNLVWHRGLGGFFAERFECSVGLARDFLGGLVGDGGHRG